MTDMLRRVVTDFNPPTPCGVGRNVPVGTILHLNISIHPPRAGWD